MRYLFCLLALLSCNTYATILTVYVGALPGQTWKVYYSQDPSFNDIPSAQEIAAATLLMESPTNRVEVPVDWGFLVADVFSPPGVPRNPATVSLLLSDDNLEVHNGRTYSPDAETNDRFFPGHFFYDAYIHTIPEPATWIAMLFGLCAYGFAMRNRWNSLVS